MAKELWHEVLRLAERGIHRQSLFLMYHGEYSEKNINQAITRALKEGMKIPDKCPRRGPYYHFEVSDGLKTRRLRQRQARALELGRQDSKS